MNLLTWLGGWLDNRLDMHLDFTGDLMTPDWSVDDGDPTLRPERKPDTLIIERGGIVAKDGTK
jgi:hypothetical protein